MDFGGTRLDFGYARIVAYCSGFGQQQGLERIRMSVEAGAFPSPAGTRTIRLAAMPNCQAAPSMSYIIADCSARR